MTAALCMAAGCADASNSDRGGTSEPAPAGSEHLGDALTESEMEELQTLIASCPELEDLSLGPIPIDVAHEVLLIPDPEPAVVCPMLSAAGGK